MNKINFYKLKLFLSDATNNEKLKIIKNIYNEDVLFDQYDYNVKNKWNAITDGDVLRFYDNLSINGISFTTIEDEDYPQSLRNINDSPCVLFYKGDINTIKNGGHNISIIGSRDCTEYGIRATEAICKKLSLYKVNIISGGAKGIDSIAHRSCLESGGKTISVLGNGISVCYPRCNKQLFNKIALNGCVISEFLPDEPSKAYNFPRRNRIIAGLCNTLIVVEGGERSGTSITTDYALEQGKSIFAVPGSIFSSKSKGPNKLIYHGASPVYDIEEMIKELNLTCNGVEKEYNNELMEYNNGVKENIFKVLTDEPIHINDIIRNVKIDTSLIYEVLFELQFKNEIVLLPGNYYAKIN